MQIVNASTGTVVWAVSFTSGGRSGGDCGSLPAGAPALTYTIKPDMEGVSITMTVQSDPVTYQNLGDGDIVAISSSIERQLPPAG